MKRIFALGAMNNLGLNYKNKKLSTNDMANSLISTMTGGKGPESHIEDSPTKEDANSPLKDTPENKSPPKKKMGLLAGLKKFKKQKDEKKETGIRAGPIALN